MSHVCEFCTELFKTSYVLKKHQITAKYCLKIQGKYEEKKKEKKEEKKFECEACLKILTTKNGYTDHIRICKEIKRQEEKKKDDELEELKFKLDEFKAENNTLKSMIDLYKSDHKIIQEMAQVPKSSTTNINSNNKYLSLTPFSLTKSEIQEQVNNNFLTENFMRGQEGVADFAYNHFLLDEHGNSKYLCNDPNRYTFTYRSKDGELNKDYKATNLTNLICEDVINKSTIISRSGLETSEEYDDKVLYVKNMEEIKNLKENNNKFAKKLSMLINTKLDMILQDETPPIEIDYTQIEDDEVDYILESCSEDEKPEEYPLHNKFMEEQSEKLTIDDIKQGVDGYVNFAIRYVFKNRLKCVNNVFQYIDKYNRPTIDKTGENICERFFKAMYRKTIIECEKYEEQLKNECKEYKSKLTPEEIGNNENIDSNIKSYENIRMIKKEIYDIKKGDSTQFLDEFIDGIVEGMNN